MNKLLTVAALLAVLTLASCKGRVADATPNGETISVELADSIGVVQEGTSESDSLSVQVPEGKVMNVTSNIDK